MKYNINKQSVQADGSDGEKMSANEMIVGKLVQMMWCEKCQRDVARIDEQNKIARVNAERHRFEISMAITDFVCHRYYEHGIIPTQSKYKDLRKGQEKWYDEQIKKGLCDSYKWINNRNHEVIN